jgi:hypothetical protein
VTSFKLPQQAMRELDALRHHPRLECAIRFNTWVGKPKEGVGVICPRCRFYSNLNAAG